jgi:hypothetical protein
MGGHKGTLRAIAWLCPIVLVGLMARAAQQAGEAPKPVAKADDVKSIDAILSALYGTISGPAGQQRDWDRFRSLFVPGARLIPIAAGREGGARARVMDVEAFIAAADANTKKAGFYEREIARRTDAFGDMAHVFSTYESRRAEGEEPFARGINSIQLLKDGDRWWVVTIYWDAERPGRPIPAEYLPKR